MWYFTRDSFGSISAIILGVIAAGAFWVLMKREETRLLGQNIAMSIREAIDNTADVDNFIEIKRMKNGIIARVYLINAKESAAAVQRAIKKSIDESSFKKYIWVMQMTDMASKNDLVNTQRILNDQLLDQLLGHRNNKEDAAKKQSTMDISSDNNVKDKRDKADKHIDN